MDRHKAILSLFILLVCTTKVVEVAFRVEEFPLTHTGLFEEYEPIEKIPWTYALEGWRRGRWREIRPWYLGINPGAMRAKLGADLDDLAQTCGELVDSLNRARPPRLRMQRGRVRAVGHARAGTGLEDDRRTIECDISVSLAEKP
ncbi:MAG: hypothetical protein P8R42_20665 [Candidatus Binatia bacterium]|nr:hypothetical protein [Candidatus Binatia bacterium]